VYGFVVPLKSLPRQHIELLSLHLLCPGFFSSVKATGVCFESKESFTKRSKAAISPWWKTDPQLSMGERKKFLLLEMAWSAWKD